MLSPFNMSPLYEAWFKSQETLLRRLINRNSAVIQYRYFLVFLLLANRRYGTAREECARILNIYPNTHMAKAVMNKFLAGASIHVRRRRHIRHQSPGRIGQCARCFPGRR